MTRYDCDVPANWESMSPEQRNEWFKQERALKQALRQDTTAASKLDKRRDSAKRRAEAESEPYIGHPDVVSEPESDDDIESIVERYTDWGVDDE